MPLSDTLDKISKKFGKDVVFQIGKDNATPMPVIPTGSIALDLALGIGGIPKGRILEIYGPESSGKTTLCQHIIANAQKMGGTCVFVDMEHAQDPRWLRVSGVDTENLYVVQPDSGEMALDLTEAFVNSGDVDLVVVDSVASLVPRAEIEGEMGASHMGLLARLMGQALRKITPNAKKNNCSVIFTNQIRHKIGVMFGSPETTPGGHALRFFASMRITTRKVETLKDKGDVYGIKIKATVGKNKAGTPYKDARFDILTETAIDHIFDVVDFASEMGLIEKRGGGYYSYGDIKLGQGKPKVKTFLQENNDVLVKIENDLRQKLGLPVIIS